MRKATYTVVQEHPSVIIRDDGPWDYKPTVTNDIESVVKELVKEGVLPFNARQQFFYYDSTCVLTGVCIDDGEFNGFFDAGSEDDEYPDRTTS
tara:strand:+ start:151622 stop:151900 length:279 start_codon:yes stop_codon:yes gene_type:complete